MTKKDQEKLIEIGEKVTLLMKKNKVTKYRINKDSGISYTQIKSVLTGTKEYTVLTLIKMLDCMNCNLNDLK